MRTHVMAAATVAWAAAMAAVFGGGAPPAGPVFRSGPTPVALIELYSSEGCSSCPPADAWLSRLKDSAGLWRAFVPVAFHVDYWDSDAWRDPWAKADFTERQKKIAERWKARRIYTPGMVAHGREWTSWSRSREPAALGGSVGVLTVRPDAGGRWTAQFMARAAGAAAPELHAVALGFGLVSKVGGGENAGRELAHDFVALAHTTVPMVSGPGGWSASFLLPEIPDGRKAGALAVWVERDGQPIQAAGGWLGRPGPGAPATTFRAVPPAASQPPGRASH